MTNHFLDVLFGAAISVALGIGGWLFKWTRGADTTLQDHTTRLCSMEDRHNDCAAKRERTEAEIWDRFNSRMDAMTAQLTEIAHSIGRLEGSAQR